VRNLLSTVVLLAFVALGCTELDSYSGTYQGTIVGSDGESFIRRGFPAGTGLVLGNFDPPPGSEGASVAALDVRHGSDVLLVGTLELIAPLEHDQLSQYDFPGGGRIRNFIFAVESTDGAFAGREAMAFVSLMDNDDIEVRLVSGKGDEAAGDLFGLFILARQ
jgi:hypothetical protein